MTALGFAVVIGLPLLVLFGTIVWPEPVAPDDGRGPGRAPARDTGGSPVSIDR